MSIAGGVDMAPARGASVGCRAMQVFVKNNNRWDGPPITPAQVTRFHSELAGAGIALNHVFAHTGYLINLASPKPDVLGKSRIAIEDELLRCGQLDIPGVVMHPGSPTGGDRDTGLRQVAAECAAVIDRTPGVTTRILFETTVGAGSHLGATFQDLHDLLVLTDRPDRTGICMDTCHIFAAGYDIRTAETYEATMKEFARVVGFKNLRAAHLNDSKHGLGTRKDRHEHIGQGHLGEEPFRLLLTDPRFAKIPMSLETEKDADLEDDRRNLATLYRLAGAEYPPP